jgi:gas vesicle protein
MRNVLKENSTKDWVRLAAKLSLLLTEPKVRKAIGDQFKSGMDDLTDAVTDKYGDVKDTVSSKYDDAVDRLDAASDALQGKSNWPSHLAGFLLGIGVGAGLGVLLAPASGSETRESVREKVEDIKNRVFESASGIRQTVTTMPSTGTEA